jgi:MFS superfamily sulfate permease-like transporter
MDYKKVENKIRAILSMEVKLAQMKLEDGVTIVEAEAFEPDYSIGIVTPDGAIPMPVGEYKLEDGTVLVVEVDGVIKSIAEKEEEAPEVEAETPEVVAEPQMEAQPKRIVESVSKESFFAEIENFRTELAELKAENEALKVSLSSMEAGADPIVTNPESEVKPSGFRFSQNKAKTIQDSVYSKMFN